jgi:hypothetical protein
LADGVGDEGAGVVVFVEKGAGDTRPTTTAATVTGVFCRFNSAMISRTWLTLAWVR